SSITPHVTSAFPVRCRRVNQSSNSPTIRNSSDRGKGKRKRDTIFFIRNIRMRTPLEGWPTGRISCLEKSPPGLRQIHCTGIGYPPYIFDGEVGGKLRSIPDR